MKRTIILILCIASIMFSSGDKRQNEPNGSVKLNYQSGVYPYKNWDEEAGSYKHDVIPNKEVALNVALKVFEGMPKNNETQDYTPQAVFYDELDEIWIVSFWKQSEEPAFGSDCSIAIQKKDGKVLRIWFGE